MSASEKKRGRLIGFVNPVGMTPAFAIPTFSWQDGSNQLLAQVIDRHGKVAGFRDFDASPSDIRPVSDEREIRVGDSSLWIFQFSEYEYILGDQLTVSKTLEGRREFMKELPFLDLQVRHFQGADEEILNASWRAYRYLRDASPRSASYWRDLVAIPPLVRQAISDAVVKMGDAEPLALADEAIEVGDGELTVSLSSLVVSKTRAFLLIAERVREIARAFGLKDSVKWDRESALPSQNWITENDLVLPTLEILASRPDEFIGTSDLIRELTAILRPTGNDAKLIRGRNDTHFSQKVRNMISHRASPTSFIRKGWATYDPGKRGLRITTAGLNLLEKRDA
jgi:hypothetical protein